MVLQIEHSNYTLTLSALTFRQLCLKDSHLKLPPSWSHTNISVQQPWLDNTLTTLSPAFIWLLLPPSACVLLHESAAIFMAVKGTNISLKLWILHLCIEWLSRLIIRLKGTITWGSGLEYFHTTPCLS